MLLSLSCQGTQGATLCSALIFQLSTICPGVPIVEKKNSIWNGMCEHIFCLGNHNQQTRPYQSILCVYECGTSPSSLSLFSYNTFLNPSLAPGFITALASTTMPIQHLRESPGQYCKRIKLALFQSLFVYVYIQVCVYSGTSTFVRIKCPHEDSMMRKKDLILTM